MNMQSIVQEAKSRVRNFMVSCFICLPTSFGCFAIGAISLKELSDLLGSVGIVIGVGVFAWLLLYGISALIIPIMFLTVGADYTLIWVRMASLPFLKWLVFSDNGKTY